MFAKRALRYTLAQRTYTNDDSSFAHMSSDHMSKYRQPQSVATDIDSQVNHAGSARGTFWLVPAATTAIMVPTAIGGLKTLVRQLQPARDVLAMASTEIDLSVIPEGKCVTFKYRNKPLFVRHRTPEQIKAADDVDPSTLRDQQAHKERYQGDAKWYISLAVCTHLGCVPLPDVGNYANGGYFCPCHGSHYDEAGRIRDGPAPMNLEVPPYKFLSDDVVKVG
jgi:ubiquinol-cytochrome c reductase iron-sulfur subunit